MKKIFLVVLLFLFFNTYSQTKVDKEAQRLENLCRKNSRVPDSLIFYGKKLLIHGKLHKHLKATIEGYFALGLASSLKSNEGLAIVYLDSAISYKEAAVEGYFSDMMRIMRNKAIIYSKKGQYTKAEEMYNEIINICKSENKMADAAYNYNGLGIAAKEQGKLNFALSQYKKAMHIWDSIGKDAPKTTLFLNIGIVQAIQGNYKQSKESYLRGLQIAKANKNERDIYKFYNNLSIIYRDTKKYDSSYYYLRKIIPYYKQKKMVYLEYLGYMNIGNTLMQQRKLDSAYWYLKKSLKGLKPTQQVKSIGQNYRLLSYVFFHQNKLDNAKVYLDSSNQINTKYNLKNNLAKDYNLYSRIYEQLNNTQKALEYSRLEKQINDSIYSAQTAKDYNELLVNQKVKEHKKNALNLKKSNELYKSNLFLVLFLFLILGVFSFFIYRNYKKGKKEINELQEKLLKLNSKYSENEANYITLKSKAVININDILYIKSDGHFVDVFLESKKRPEIERISLVQFLTMLPTGDFIRIHKSYIVNIHKIKIINATQLMLVNGEWIKLSRTYKPHLKEILNKV